jgi:hypothetical protein
MNMTATQTHLPISFELPIRGSNEDHLDIFAEAGATYGGILAEKIAAGFRQAKRAGVATATVVQYAKALKNFGLAADAAILAVKVARYALPPDATVKQYLTRVARGDLESMRADLVRRGYRENQIVRFRVSAWRAFKLALREAGKITVQ